MNYHKTAISDRLHIAIYGRRNSGKSSLMNALTSQDCALVSDVPGTTTDVVTKPMELKDVGPCLIIDTPGFDDDDFELGEKRITRTLNAIERTDIALFICSIDFLTIDEEWVKKLKIKKIPIIPIVNVVGNDECPKQSLCEIEEMFGVKPVILNAKEKWGMEELRIAIFSSMPKDFDHLSITRSLVIENDVVLLVMPQDSQAPKGRIIQPQVQVLRELLDKKAVAICCVPENLEITLKQLVKPPKLIITDSQVFKTVYSLKPAETMLTSFSILMAGYKGDIYKFIEGAATIEMLTENSKVLIAEACTHAPASEDIGRVKIPQLLRRKIGQNLKIDIVSGNDFPTKLLEYDLVIHCGACMFNRQHVMNRLNIACEQNVPMTNYGVVIAYLNGIIDKIVY